MAGVPAELTEAIAFQTRKALFHVMMPDKSINSWERTDSKVWINPTDSGEAYT